MSLHQYFKRENIAMESVKTSNTISGKMKITTQQTSPVEVTLNEEDQKNIAATYLEKLWNWNREYFIENGQVKVNITHYSSHSWDTVDLVRKASSRDVFAEKVFQHLYKR